ncbi:peptide-methionine (R)-S-oxide reductase MsrB [Rahnella aquatilis]|uniref:peptide-methionine (R)-S-oxide reductase MsrB n=1 Tax=Rahnella aquatilis TaxID=34038 RepID=UPI00365AFFD8
MSIEAKSSSTLEQLTEIQRYVTQEHGTEPPFSGKLLHNRREGIYHCVVCGSALFYSDTKYDSGCGWPSFYQPVHPDAIKYLTDKSHNRARVEIRCSCCEAHLGHVFPDGPKPTGERYCINSASMSFTDGKNGDKTAG